VQVRHWLREAFDEVRDALAHRAGQLRRAVQGPGRERDVVVQIFKTVAAGVIAWEITANVVQAPTPFFAPLAAIAVVQATVARSVSEGWQQMVAVLAGVVLAFAVARLLGITAVSIALVLLVSLLIGRWNRLGNSGFQVPATALIMLIVAGQQSEASFVARLVETAIGLGVGLVLNALIAPPVHLGSLQTAVEDLAGEVEKVIRQLVDALRTKGPDVDAEQLLRRVRRLDGLVADAREAYDRAKESLHLNPDPRARRRGRVEVPLPRSKAWIDALGDATDVLRGIARTLLESTDPMHRRSEDDDRSVTSPLFLEPYADLLQCAAEAVGALVHDDKESARLVESAVERGRRRQAEIADRVRTAQLRHPDAWRTYGALLVDAETLFAGLERARSVAP
jgi:uncharacterized membrane protein YccC